MIAQNIATIRQNIQRIAENCERDSKKIQLIAVSKTKPVELIEAAIEAGQFAFGENYVQEGVDKIAYFKTLARTDLVWHFIGPLQSNKTKLVAENFDWIHTVDRLKIATRLNEQRPEDLPKLNVLIQVNISNERTKSGILPEQLNELADKISVLPHLQLRGLMAIPAVEDEYQKQFATFEKMYQLFIKLQQQYENIDTLSMGMTDDMSAAIAAGSTMVRIGTAIFGSRQYN